MWEHVGTNLCYATSNFFFAFWLPTCHGSYGPCKLQVLQETQQAIGEERWTQPRKALPRCFKDVQMIRQNQPSVMLQCTSLQFFPAFIEHSQLSDRS